MVKSQRALGPDKVPTEKQVEMCRYDTDSPAYVVFCMNIKKILRQNLVLYDMQKYETWAIWFMLSIVANFNITETQLCQNL